MLKTFFASTAIASTLGFAALAQEAADPLVQEPDAPAAEAPAVPADPATEMAQEPAADPAAPGTMMTEPDPAMDPAMERILTPVATADISVDSLIGASIQTRDGENLAAIDDVLMGPDGQMESVVATFGGFLGFGSEQVLLTPDEFEVLQDEAGTYVVQTDLTPDALEGRPAYTAEQ